MFDYSAAVASVTDGDTVKLTVDLGFHVYVTESFRLAGINAPEKDTDAGMASKHWLMAKLPPGTVVYIRSEKAVKQEKYGRWMCNLWLSEDAQSTSLNAQLVQAGLAKPWDGKGARPV